MRGTSSGIECLELESCRRQSQVTGLYGSSGAEKRKLGPTKWSRARRSHRFVPACPRKTFAPHALRLSKPQSLVSVSHPRLDTNAYRLELVLAFQRRRCWPYFRFRQALETATSEMEHPLSINTSPAFVITTAPLRQLVLVATGTTSSRLAPFPLSGTGSCPCARKHSTALTNWRQRYRVILTHQQEMKQQ